MKDFLKGLFIVARPTTIKVPSGGEIILKNCSKETIDSVRALVRAEPKVEETRVEVPIEMAAPIPISIKESPLSCTGLGVYQHPLTLNWHLCTLKFSPYTKEAKVEYDSPVDKDKATCDERFKIAAVHNNLIG